MDYFFLGELGRPLKKENDMPSKILKWNVWGHVTGTKYIGIVEASSREEAEEKGFEHANCSANFCH